MIVRPIRETDWPAISRFARVSGCSVINLPNDSQALKARMARSFVSFAADVDTPGEQGYIFVLEVEGEVVGTSALIASAGLDEAFYNYRREILVHASPSLKVHNKIHVLSMSHELTGYTQLCGFYIDPAWANTHAAALLSRARLLFIASFQQRFAAHLLAEMFGVVDEQQQSPFWDAVGRKFFHVDFAAAEHLFSTHERTFLAELMPAYPIYVPLLPAAAQAAIGAVPPAAQLPYRLLCAEGFETSHYLDIFDGGAVLTAKTHEVHTVAHSRVARVEVGIVAPHSPVPYLIATQKTGEFRVTHALAWLDEQDVLWLTPEVAEMLRIEMGDVVRVVAAEEGG